MLRDLERGLGGTSKSLPPKYFYDERGSELFDEITQLPEYYPTRAERSVLQQRAADIIAVATPRTLIELGAGSATKTRLLLDAMLDAASNGVTYIPVDVSKTFIERTSARLGLEYSSRLRISPVVADFSSAFDLPQHDAPTLHCFLGSTIGNFRPVEARRLLGEIHARMNAGDSFLLGADLRKDSDMIERAYNDSRGVTREFNLNMLRVINRVAGADFDPHRWDHQAIYDRGKHRIEMRLIANSDQTVHIPELGDFAFTAGDSILTEVSYKYHRASISDLMTRSGLELVQWLTDDSSLFALALARRSH